MYTSSCSNDGKANKNYGTTNFLSHQGDRKEISLKKAAEKKIFRKTNKYDPELASDESTKLLLEKSERSKDQGLADPVGFAVVCLVALVGDMARGIMFPTLWPLISKLGGTKVSQGYAVAAFSFGRILSAPSFGRWSVSYGYTRTLIVSHCILFIGTLLYSQASAVGRPEFLIFAQTILGVGSGTLGVTRAFVSDVSPHEKRTMFLSFFSSVQYAGFTVTPLLGAFFSHYFGHHSYKLFNGLISIDAFTSPAYFMTFMCAILLLLLSTVFQGRNSGPKTKKKKVIVRDETDTVATQKICMITVYELVLIGCMLLNFATRGSISVFETMNVVIAESRFGLNNAYVGLIVGICGSIGVSILLSMGIIIKYFSDVELIGIGMCFMCLGNLFFLNLRDDDQNPHWLYMFALFLVYAVGYPIGNTAAIGLFSKIVGQRPQGTLQGLFASAGSLARIIFPIASGYISQLFGGLEPLLILIIVVMGTCCSVCLVNRGLLMKLSK